MDLFPPFPNLTDVGSKDALNPLIKQKCNQMHFINLLQKMLTSQKCRGLSLENDAKNRTKQRNQSDQQF